MLGPSHFGPGLYDWWYRYKVVVVVVRVLVVLLVVGSTFLSSGLLVYFWSVPVSSVSEDDRSFEQRLGEVKVVI